MESHTRRFLLLFFNRLIYLYINIAYTRIEHREMFKRENSLNFKQRQ